MQQNYYNVVLFGLVFQNEGVKFSVYEE